MGPDTAPSATRVPGTGVRRRRRLHRKARRARLAKWLTLLFGLCAACAVYLARPTDRAVPPAPGVPDQAAGPAAASQAGRRVYPYSIIPGGVYSEAELRSALLRDPVAARHYASFQPALLHTTELAGPRTAYVSYRMGSSVYWTRHPIRLPKGDTLITDGVNFARARCGNRVSAEPQKPVAQFEPPPPALEVLPVAMLEPPAIPWHPAENQSWNEVQALNAILPVPPLRIIDPDPAPPPIDPALPPWRPQRYLPPVPPPRPPYTVPEPGSLVQLLTMGAVLALVGRRFHRGGSSTDK
jgi:hypothetical protein